MAVCDIFPFSGIDFPSDHWAVTEIPTDKFDGQT